MGIAFFGYHDAVGCFPPGQLTRPSLDGSLGLWSISVLPYLEASSLFNTYNCNINFLDVPPDFIVINNTALHVSVSSYMCPSDEGGYCKRYSPLGWSRSNYVAAYSPDGSMVEPGVPWTYDFCNNSGSLQPARRRALTNVNIVRGTRDVLDGTSNTVVLSEAISDPDGSLGYRGTWWNPLGQNYTHLRNPNSPIPDSMWRSVAYIYNGCDKTKAPCDDSAACWSTHVYSAGADTLVESTYCWPTVRSTSQKTPSTLRPGKP